jgi:hypothetical protein
MATIFFWLVGIKTGKVWFNNGYLFVKESYFSKAIKILPKDIQSLNIVLYQDDFPFRRDIKFGFIDYLRIAHLKGETLSTIYVVSEDSLLLKNQLQLMMKDESIKCYFKSQRSILFFVFKFIYFMISMTLAIIFDVYNLLYASILLGSIYAFIVTFTFKFMSVKLYRVINKDYYLNLDKYAIHYS